MILYFLLSECPAIIEAFTTHFSALIDHARIISQVDPDQFGDCFIGWMRHVYEKSEDEVIAIDGKTLRGSYSHSKAIKAVCTIV